MTKTSKKILLVILLAILSVFMLYAKVFAVSNVEQAVAELKNKDNFKDRTVFVGQRMEVFSNNNYSILYYIRPTIKSSNPSVVDFEVVGVTHVGSHLAMPLLHGPVVDEPIVVVVFLLIPRSSGLVDIPADVEQAEVVDGPVHVAQVEPVVVGILYLLHQLVGHGIVGE